jgi:hypothetical protein
MTDAPPHANALIFTFAGVFAVAYVFIMSFAAKHEKYKRYSNWATAIFAILSLASTIASTRKYDTPASSDIWKAEFNVGTDIITVVGCVCTIIILACKHANVYGYVLAGLGLAAAIMGLISSVASRNEHFGTPFSGVAQPWVGAVCFVVGGLVSLVLGLNGF